MIGRRALILGGMTAAILPQPVVAAITGKKSKMPEAKIVELRQYTLFGGQRDTLIDLFEREFIAPQNALGARVLGTFTDLDDPDRFVWFRGFSDMEARGQALSAFYGGPVWWANRNSANATMRDSDNVLLLRLLSGSLGPRHENISPAVYAICIHYLHGDESERFADFFETTLRPMLAKTGIDVFATLATETAPNNFPKLPVREQERVFVRIEAHRSIAEMEAIEKRLAHQKGWRDKIPNEILPALMRKPERIRLVPTASSVLR